MEKEQGQKLKNLQQLQACRFVAAAACQVPLRCIAGLCVDAASVLLLLLLVHHLPSVIQPYQYLAPSCMVMKVDGMWATP